MNNFNTYSISNSFESIENKTEDKTPIFNNLKAKIGSLLNAIAAPMVAGKEPKIWLSFDQLGNSYWNAYDPQSNQYARNLSEAEMRVWLEKRY